MASGLMRLVGPAVLGDLQYNNANQAWLVELGYFLAAYELTSNQSAQQSNNLVESHKTATRTINSILRERGILIQFEDYTYETEYEHGQKISGLLTTLITGWSPSHAVMVRLSQAAGYLHMAPQICLDDGSLNAVRDTARGMITDDIANLASELDIATDSLWKTISDQPPQSFTAPRFRQLITRMQRPLVVLILSGDPSNTGLRVATAKSQLTKALRGTKYGNSFEIRDDLSCGIADVSTAVGHYQPNILLFEGHGSSSGLYFQHDPSQGQVVTKSALAENLQNYPSIQMVVLNACYSNDEAQNIADVVGHVIAMEGVLDDEDAVYFDRELFTALGRGDDFQTCFRKAKDAVHMSSLATIRPHLLVSQSNRST